MAILGNAGPVDPGGVFSAVLAAGKDKNLTLQQLRKFYTQLIQESIRDGDEGRESRLIQKYMTIGPQRPTENKNDLHRVQSDCRFISCG